MLAEIWWKAIPPWIKGLKPSWNMMRGYSSQNKRIKPSMPAAGFTVCTFSVSSWGLDTQIPRPYRPATWKASKPKQANLTWNKHLKEKKPKEIKAPKKIGNLIK